MFSLVTRFSTIITKATTIVKTVSITSYCTKHSQHSLGERVVIFGFLAQEAREIDKNWFVSTAFDYDCSSQNFCSFSVFGRCPYVSTPRYAFVSGALHTFSVLLVKVSRARKATAIKNLLC